MKKTYIKPSVEIVNINTQQVIAASSNGIFFDDADDTTGWGNLNDDSAEGPAMSRGSNLWED